MTDRTSTPNPRPTVRLLSLSAGVRRRFGYTLFTESPRIPHIPQEDQRIAPPGIRQP